MAEFIIRWHAHWMDALTSEQVAALSVREREKYDRRKQKGDILEVWPDGEGGWRVKGSPYWVVVKVPGLAVDYDYMAPLTEYIGINPTTGEPEYKILKRCKWALNIAALPAGVLNALNTDRVVTRNVSQFNSIVRLKTS